MSFLLLISLAYGVLAVATILGDGPVIDEVEHIASGYFYLKTGLNSLNTSQPLLIKIWSALPLSIFPFNDGFSFPFRPEASSGASYAYNLLYDVPNFPVAMVGLARAAMIGLNVILLWTLGFALAKIIGRRPALLSITLLAISPTFFSHSRYVTNDVTVALLISLTIALFSYYLTKPGTKYLVLALIALFLSIQTKFSSLIILPVILAFVLVFPPAVLRKIYLRKILVLGVSLSFVLIISYWGIATRFRSTPSGRLRVASSYWIPESGFEAVTKGFIYQINRLQSGGREPGYLGGVLYSGGDPRFFTTLFLLKEPIGWLLFICAGIFALAIRWRSYIESQFLSPHRTLVALNTILILLYGLTAIFSNLNIGVRHLLPIYPALTLLASLGNARLVGVGFSRVRYILISLAVASWLSAFPHFLSYYNLLAGQYPQFWAVDSNFDWGQDSLRLVKQILNSGKKQVALVDYFGRGHPLHYLQGRMISWSSAMGKPPPGSTLYVSSTRIQQARGRRLTQPWGFNYEWLDDLEPVDTIGKTILVYRISP